MTSTTMTTMAGLLRPGELVDLAGEPVVIVYVQPCTEPELSGMATICFVNSMGRRFVDLIHTNSQIEVFHPGVIDDLDGVDTLHRLGLRAARAALVPKAYELP